MPEDRMLTRAEVEHEVAEVQIGALQAYASFMEELVAAMLVARLADSRWAAIEQRKQEAPELVDPALIERAMFDAQERNGIVGELFKRGAALRLTCAKIGAMPLEKPIVQVPAEQPTSH